MRTAEGGRKGGRGCREVNGQLGVVQQVLVDVTYSRE